ncbi:MAG: hypothetical protein AAFN92_22445, partial [Bacteroidota bacterium]
DEVVTDFAQSGTVEGNRATVLYRGGNGNRRLFVASTNPITWTPTDDREYSSNASFGAGEEVSPGVFAVTTATGTSTVLRSLTIRDLLPSTTYYLAAFEYNVNNDGTVVFYQILPAVTAEIQTATAPASAPANIVFSANTGSTVRIDWDAVADANRYLVVMKQGAAVDFVPTDLTTYPTSTTFGIRDLGNDNFAIANVSTTGTTVLGLDAATVYHVAIFAFNGSSGPIYRTIPGRADFLSLATPSMSGSDLRFQSIEGDRVTIRWTLGNGARQIIVARQGQAVAAAPQDGQTYTDGPFGSGSELAPGEFVVWEGAATRFTAVVVENLLIGTNYHFAIFEFNVAPDGSTFYRRTDPARGE